MATKQEIRIAKEIKTNLYLLLLGVLLTGLLYGILFFTFQPPVNKPVSESTKNRIRESRYKQETTFVGDAFSSSSKYDEGLSISDILDDTINEHRHSRFIDDINEKTTIIAPWIFIVLIFGRYLIIGINWVNKTSNQNE